MAGKHLREPEQKPGLKLSTPTILWLVGALVVTLLAGGWWFLSERSSDDNGTDVASGTQDAGTRTESGSNSAVGDDNGQGEVEETTTTTTTTTLPPIPASERSLELIEVISGDLSSKSVVSSQAGHFIAQNMMYRHTMSVFNRDFNLVATIPDTITPAAYGFDFDPGTTLRGAPVEAAFLPDGSAAYVSNYHMYGPGYGPEPSDSCPRMTTDNAFVYVVSMESLTIEDIIQVGTVPKYLAVSPAGATVTVANWCSYDVSIIDVEAGEEVARIDVGRYPRGVAYTPSGDRVYVAIMGGNEILEIDIASRTIASRFPMSGTPRHLVMDPAGAYLYISRNRAGDVVKVDLDTKEIVGSVTTGTNPRSMDVSPDGEALYVGNYTSNTLSKVLTADMSVVQTVPTGHHPIGLTVDHATYHVWVANYSGTIQVFEDQPSGAPTSE